MHRYRHTVCATLLLAGCSLAATADPAVPPAVRYISGTVDFPDAAGVNEFYPFSARDARAEGLSAVDCEVHDDGSLSDCHSIFEDPKGFGFGAAAAAMFESYGRFDVAVLKRGLQPKDRIRQVFNWQLASVTAAIRPSTKKAQWSGAGQANSQPDSYYSAGDWSYPGTDQMGNYYPRKALRDRLDGLAVIECVAAQTGEMDVCSVVTQSPEGYGFGEATVDMFFKFGHVSPAVAGGRLKPGDRKRFTYKWSFGS